MVTMAHALLPSAAAVPTIATARGEGKAVDGFVAHEVAEHITVRVGRAMPELPTRVEREVERLWQVAARRVAAGGAGPMFNGRVFSADTITPHCVTGHLTEYRRVVAQIERPELFAELRLRAFAVCGVLRCAGGVVLGQRHRAAVYQPGMWQTAPAGSVDAGAVARDGTVDLRRQLLSELHEELGLSSAETGALRPLCIIEHPGSHVSDLGMALVTYLNAETVLAAHCNMGNGEYQRVAVVPETELSTFLATLGEKLAPSTGEFLIRAGLVFRT
jgi:hypothetical protein